MLNKKLPDIIEPVKAELAVFHDTFKRSMKSNVGIVDLITRYILKQKGKKIRPVLVLLSAKVCGGITERSHRGAVLVELLHTATLVHDDVVDNADKRRGFPSINAIWKNKGAVLMGDYLLARGLLLSVTNSDHDFLEVVTDTVKRMSEGELLQIQKTRKLDIDEETYYRIIGDKTASLIETCCRVGAMSATEDETKREALRSFGENLGIAFQIQDDILDYEGTTKIFGKPIGGDIKEKKITLPLIHSLKQVSGSEAAHIRKIIKKGDTKEEKKQVVKEVIDFVHENGGIEYASSQADIFAQKAIAAIELFPQSDSKDSLLNLVRFVIERKI